MQRLLRLAGDKAVQEGIKKLGIEHLIVGLVAHLWDIDGKCFGALHYFNGEPEFVRLVMRSYRDVFDEKGALETKSLHGSRYTNGAIIHDYYAITPGRKEDEGQWFFEDAELEAIIYPGIPKETLQKLLEDIEDSLKKLDERAVRVRLVRSRE